MKAPDKIYVASYNGESFSHSWTQEPLGDTTVTEYIRKGALLKKISELRAIPHDHAMERDNAFIEVIGIIESL